MSKSKKFVPMKVYVNERAYNLAKKKAEDKLKILSGAFSWCSNHINTDAIDRSLFLNDMVAEFRRCLQKEKGSVMNAKLSDEKLMFLLDIQDSQLKNYEIEYRSIIEAEVKVADNGDDWYSKVDIEDYTRYTTSNEENEKIIRGNNLVKALDLVAKYAKVYPLGIQQAISSFLIYDMGSQTYRVNI